MIVNDILGANRPIPDESLTYWNKFFQFVLAVLASTWLLYTMLRGGFRSSMNSVTSAKIPA